mmetsp:Transcript_3986/g.5877  ORF Transcript_3986/g.5877 Transcript_3986/m.5877 type:complete len:360 (+) Transcript_3986:149-1228(+)
MKIKSETKLSLSQPSSNLIGMTINSEDTAIPVSPYLAPSPAVGNIPAIPSLTGRPTTVCPVPAISMGTTMVTLPPNKRQKREQTVAETEESVRQDEIEAALRSKPQRGRKRENLSVLERIELTRTRNREHAKSTRLRKKMRHQELVDKEVELEELKKSVNLDEQRAETVREFIKSREIMLTSHESSPLTLNTSLHDSLDGSKFSMTVRGPFANKTAVSMADAFTLMNEWDSQVQQMIKTKFGNTVTQLCYSVEDGYSGVAFSKSNAAMFELSLIGKEGDNSLKLMEVVVKCLFASGSRDIIHAQWNVTWHAMERTATVQSDQSRRAVVLRDQISFPSVISFENHCNDSEVAVNNPGIHI